MLGSASISRSSWLAVTDQVLPILQIGPGKNFAERQAVGSEIVITQRASLIGIIQDGEPPGAFLRT